MKIVQYLFLISSFFIIQSVPFQMLPGTSYRPDMIIILVVHFALVFGRARGMAFGMGAGFFHDLMLCGPVGQGVLSMGIAGMYVGALRESYLSDKLSVRIVLVAGVTLTDLLIKTAMFRMAYKVAVGQAALVTMGPQLAVNIVCALVFMPLLVWLDRYIDRAHARSEERKKLQSFLMGVRITE